jgi:hypothetical protein
LARLVLKDKTNSDICELFKSASWKRRRFNPALGYLLEHLPETGYVVEKGTEFQATNIWLNADVKFALTEFSRQ